MTEIKTTGQTNKRSAMLNAPTFNNHPLMTMHKLLNFIDWIFFSSPPKNVTDKRKHSMGDALLSSVSAHPLMPQLQKNILDKSSLENVDFFEPCKYFKGRISLI